MNHAATPAPADDTDDPAATASPTAAPKSREMRTADTANGENPDADAPSPATAGTDHPTGEQQARETPTSNRLPDGERDGPSRHSASSGSSTASSAA